MDFFIFIFIIFVWNLTMIGLRIMQKLTPLQICRQIGSKSLPQLQCLMRIGCMDLDQVDSSFIRSKCLDFLELGHNVILNIILKILFQRDEAVFLIVFLHHLLYQRISESWKFDIYDIVAELEGEPLISDLASLLNLPQACTD